MKSIEQVAWEADQLGMSYGEYVALCESAGNLKRELERRGKEMPDYKAFRAKARKARKNAKKAPPPREQNRPTPMTVNRARTPHEHVVRCPICTIKFKTTDGARKYCSMACAQEARNARDREKRRARRARTC